MNQLQDYLNVLRAAIIVLDNVIKSLNIHFLNIQLNLLTIFGSGLMTAIISAILFPTSSEYDMED